MLFRLLQIIYYIILHIKENIILEDDALFNQSLVEK